MFIVQNPTTAILLCMITMVGWGSWANTQKMAGKARWPFQLYYWDYAVGVLLFSILFAFTAGSTGSSGQAALPNFQSASASSIGAALLSGTVFNLANLLLVAAIDAAGMSVAFPLGIGLALAIGTIASYIQSPHGDPAFLFGGVVFIVAAMLLSAAASARSAPKNVAEPAHNRGTRGILFSIAAGCLMGLFYPQLMLAISPAFNTSPIVRGKLTPYTAAVVFAIGLLLSNFVINTVFMKLAGVTFQQYRQGSAWLHVIGILGGAIWMLALCVNVVASGVAGPAVSYALGQGATLVAAIWGVFIWKEFQHAPRISHILIGLMFACYAAGLVLVGKAIL
ncbi:MAG TPA: GRP family sugar transporter [Bryobacteraceae bacterium]|nr:GRP family sugar transporter [Bryobacteraceae bacterium]